MKVKEAKHHLNEECEKNLLKDEILNEAIHKCVLKKVIQKQDFFCDSVRMIFKDVDV